VVSLREGTDQAKEQELRLGRKLCCKPQEAQDETQQAQLGLNYL